MGTSHGQFNTEGPVGLNIFRSGPVEVHFGSRRIELVRETMIAAKLRRMVRTRNAAIQTNCDLDFM
jgi:hypothetical protein